MVIIHENPIEIKRAKFLLVAQSSQMNPLEIVLWQHFRFCSLRRRECNFPFPETRSYNHCGLSYRNVTSNISHNRHIFCGMVLTSVYHIGG